MALTQLQASDQYILDSVAQFVIRNVKTPYDPLVTGSAYSNSDLNINKPLRVMLGKPSDSSIALNPPAIGIDDVSGPTAGWAPYEIGSSLGWRFMTVALYCYPAVNSINGEPSAIAETLLKGILRNVASTYSFRILDYSNASFNPTNILYCADTIVIDRFSAPSNRMKSSPNALERNRFDITMSLSYPVSESLVN